jgi:hypothetical protein
MPLGAITELECAVYDEMRIQWPEYRGAYWQYVKLSNGGGYLYPDVDVRTLTLSSPNGAVEVVGRESAGMVATMVAVNKLCWHHHERGREQLATRYADLYHKLRDYAFDSPEAGPIIRLMD